MTCGSMRGFGRGDPGLREVHIEDWEHDRVWVAPQVDRNSIAHRGHRSECSGEYRKFRMGVQHGIVPDRLSSLFTSDIVAMLPPVLVGPALNCLEECTVFFGYDHVVLVGRRTGMYGLDIGPWVETVTASRWQHGTQRPSSRTSGRR